MIKQLHLIVLSALLFAFGISASAQDVVTFTFNQENSYEQFGLAGWSSRVNDVDTTDGDITEEKSLTSGDVTFTVTPATGNTATRMYKDYNGNFGLRAYGGTQIIISSTKNIAKIEFTSKKFNFAASEGTLNGTTWTAAEATSVTFECSKSSTIETVTVTLGEGSVDPNPNPDPEPTETVAENIAAFNALCTKDGVDVTLNLKDAKVLYVNEFESKGQHKQEVFVKDATGSVMFYNVGLTASNGDVINGSIKGAAKDFYGTKEFCNNANTDLTTIAIESGDLAAGEVKALNEISDNDISNLIAVNDVKMISREETDDKGKTHTNFYMVDAAGNELAYYNTFKVAGFDAADFVEKTGLNFIGIIKLHFGKKQLCPVDPVNTGIDCIENVELNVNAPMYNVAGQKVNANFKGIVLQNGKKFINK